MVEAQFGTKFSRLRCDNSGENTSNNIKEFCFQKGIKTELTIPYTPEQNDHAERMNRTLIEKDRVLLLQSSLGKNMWGEAVLTATYHINRSPSTSTLNKIPAELWFKRRSNNSNLRVFGPIAHLHLPKQIITKFDSKSKQNIMIGYTTHGYRFWCQETKKIITSRDVIFEENVKDQNKISKDIVTYYPDKKSFEDNPNEENTKDIKTHSSVKQEKEEYDKKNEKQKIYIRPQRTIRAPNYLQYYDTLIHPIWQRIYQLKL